MSTNPPRVPGFEDLTHIAAGGFGSVYRGVDEHIGRVVAIKVLDRLDVSSSRNRDRFLRETRAMGKLSGLPHVVDIYQATFTEDGTPCIVMPYLSGGSLADVLRARGSLTPDEVLTLGATIARALDSAHRRGISHRDIKPENILLDENGDPGLADFGIAITADAAASTRTRFALSPEHAPPERLSPPAGTTPAETSGDIYSLASTLFMLMTGHPPFGSEAEVGAYEFVRRVVEDPPPSLDVPGADPAADAVLRKGLAKDPQDRYATALDFAVALEAVPHTPTPVRLGFAGRSTSAPTAGVGDAGSATPTGGDGSPTVAPVAGATRAPARDRRRPDAEPSGADQPLPPPVPQPLDPTLPPAAATVYRARPEAAAPPIVPDEDEEAGPPKLAVGAGIGLAVVIVIVVALAIRGGRSDSPAPTTTVDLAKVPIGSVAAGTPQAPVVQSISPLADGGFSFRWSDPNTQGDFTNAYRVSVDGTKANTMQMKVDETTLEPLEEQFVNEITVGSRTEKVDTKLHRYCVVVRHLSTTASYVDSEEKCLDRSA